MGRWASKRNKNTVRDEIYDRLTSMLNAGMGRSRHADKIAGISDKYIYSKNTFNTYMRESKYFYNWLRQNHPEVKHLRHGRQYVDEYLSALIAALKEDGSPKYSAYTIATKKAAICRLYGISGTDCISTPVRRRQDIKRGRGEQLHDSHISDAMYERYACIGRVTGLRKRELEHIRGDDLHQADDGTYWLDVTEGTKGGKPRHVLLLGSSNEDLQSVVKLFRTAGPSRVCPKLPSHYHEHQLRAVYARNLYSWAERRAHPDGKIPPKDRYICRKDRAGIVYDKRAMLFVSKSMGHNRIDVIAEHYL